MTKKNYLRISAHELRNIQTCLQCIETALYEDSQIPRLLKQRGRESLQSLDRVQQELTFIATLLENLSHSSVSGDLDKTVAFLESSPLRSMADRFQSLQLVHNATDLQERQKQ